MRWMLVLGVILLLLSVSQGASDIYVTNNCKNSIRVFVRESPGGAGLLVGAPNSAPRPRKTSSPTPAPAPDIFKISPIPPPNFKQQKKLNYLLIVAAPGSVALVVLVGGITFGYLRYKSRKSHKDSELLDTSLLLPKQFKYRELAAAAGQFDKLLLLGGGGFGSVYKATLLDGSVVAVKRMTDTRQPGHAQFKAEVASLGNIHHFHLVKLKGFCVRGLNECLLVYEYMPNGSLDKWIFNKGGNSFLNWSTRMSIAVEVAQGLAYLHGGCNERVLHLDIKPQNILLDENFRAKISDFGLAKLVDRDKSEIFTLHMRGTPGYMAPEQLHGLVTDKSDVFSYGVLLLQLVSGKSTLEIPSRSDSDIKLLSELASISFQNNSLELMVDERLLSDETLSMADVGKLVRVGLWCIQTEPALRPSMDTVVKMIQGVIDVPDPPILT